MTSLPQLPDCTLFSFIFKLGNPTEVYITRALIFTRKQNPEGVINDTIVQMAYSTHAARAPPPLTRVARITLGTNLGNLLSHDVVSSDVDHDVLTAYCTASLLHAIR